MNIYIYIYISFTDSDSTIKQNINSNVYFSTNILLFILLYKHMIPAIAPKQLDETGRYHAARAKCGAIDPMLTPNRLVV